mmetsp:Transcript_31554/g.50689  ORF Transcript_31554/g.50689 Transcript_31554/m.50689 type:complete len:204 (-) Transcript_31554:73-684(-)
MSIPQPSTCAGLGPWKWSDARGEVVCLGGKKNIPVSFLLLHLARLIFSSSRNKHRDGIRMRGRMHGGGVVMESNHRVVGLRVHVGLLNDLEERSRLFFAVNYHLTPEEPMAGVFRVGLRHVVHLHGGRVTLELLAKEINIQLNVLLVEAKTMFITCLSKCLRPFFQKRNKSPILGFVVEIEGLQRLKIHHLGHSVVEKARANL